MTKHKLGSLCALLVGVLALPSVSSAGDDDQVTPKETPPPVTAAPTSKISGDLGLGVTTAYISRGLVLNNEGAINQDYADLYVDLYDSTGFLNKVQGNLGIWTDLDPHSTQAGTATGHPSSSSQTTPWWYEFDFLPGFTFTFDKIFTFTPSYYVFLSPSSSFHTFQGANLNLGVDDSKWLGKFALHPSLTFLRELFNKAGDGTQQGDYYEIGITPSTAVGPVTLSVPVTLGLGSNRFYGHNQGFGYVTPGFTAAVPLKFIPASYGSWNFSATYKYYYFGSDLAEFNSQQGEIAPGAENESVRRASHHTNLVQAGLTLTFP
jgi:hypothetical protein